MPELQRDTRRSLAAALLDLPNINDQAVRAQLMLDWPPTLRANVALSNIPSIDLNSMIVTGAGWATPDGSKPPLVLLIENAQDLVHGSKEEGTLGTILVAVQRDLAPAMTILTDPAPASLLVPPADRAARFAELVTAFRGSDYDRVIELSHGLPSDYPGLAPLVQRAESDLAASKIIADKIAAAWADEQWDEVLRLAKQKPPPPASIQPLIADAEQALTPAPGPPVAHSEDYNARVLDPESYTVDANGRDARVLGLESYTVDAGGRWTDQLVDTLTAIPAYAERRNRDLLLLDLPPAVVGTIPRADDPAADLSAIVATLTQWGTLDDGTPALATLIENAATLTPDAGLAPQYAAWLAEMAANPPTPLASPARFQALVWAYAHRDWPAVKAWVATLPADYPGLQPLLARMPQAHPNDAV